MSTNDVFDPGITEEQFLAHIHEATTAALRSKLFTAKVFVEGVIVEAEKTGQAGGQKFSPQFIEQRRAWQDWAIGVIEEELRKRDEMPEALILTKNGVKTLTREQAERMIAEAEEAQPRPPDQVVKLKTLTLDGSAPAPGS